MLNALAAALLAAAATVAGEAQAPAPKPGTEKVTPQVLQQAKNLMEDITVVGCVRAWKPAPDDPTKASRQPGVAGVYLLTPLSSNPTTAIDVPTYLLTPSATVDFAQHLDHKVEIVGTSQAAPMPPTVQEIATAPTQRPENKPNPQSLPRLTVKTLKLISETCPS